MMFRHQFVQLCLPESLVIDKVLIRIVSCLFVSGEKKSCQRSEDDKMIFKLCVLLTTCALLVHGNDVERKGRKSTCQLNAYNMIPVK